MRCLPLALLLFALLLRGATPARPDGVDTLLTGVYPQRLSDRYTTAGGLPGKRVSFIRVEGRGGRVRAQTDAGPAVFEGGAWKADAGGGVVEPEMPPIDRARLPRGAHILSAAKAPDGRLWIVTDAGAFRSAGQTYARVTPPASYLTHQTPVNVDAVIFCVTVDRNGTIWLGSSMGIFATDGANWWNVIDRTTGLPYEDVTCLTMAPDGEIWAGTAEGVCRCVNGAWQYYWGPRWLPGNRVNAIAADPKGGVWVATDGGVAHLYDRRMTLEQKAAHYEQITRARHNRSGFVTGGRLKIPGNVNGGLIHEASDNDGLWTAVYVAAEAYRYAATHDPRALAAARESMRALLNLVRYSGVPGFPARAIIRQGEEVDGYDANETVRIPGETEKIWYRSPADAKVLCKGDTSSDELDGHYYAWSIYYNLVADAVEKEQIRATVQAVTDNILEHDLTLVGHTGRRTLWGVWSPRFLNDDPSWWEERGLNALEILSYLKVAEQICAQPRYAQKARELIEKHHYLLNAVTQKVDEPWWSVNHSDDQMAFMMYYTLMQREKDPATRRVLLQSLDRSWRIERLEHSPFFNFIYGACSGQRCDSEAAVATLQEWPWELIDWQVRGTHRHDVTVLTHRGEARAREQLTRALPASERCLMRWNGNPYECDGGSPDGRNEEDGSAWLLPYWLGRYHRFIAPQRGQ